MPLPRVLCRCASNWRPSSDAGVLSGLQTAVSRLQDAEARSGRSARITSSAAGPKAATATWCKDRAHAVNSAASAAGHSAATAAGKPGTSSATRSLSKCAIAMARCTSAAAASRVLSREAGSVAVTSTKGAANAAQAAAAMPTPNLSGRSRCSSVAAAAKELLLWLLLSADDPSSKAPCVAARLRHISHSALSNHSTALLCMLQHAPSHLRMRSSCMLQGHTES